MKLSTVNSRTSVYNVDFYGWIRQQSDLIRANNVSALDVDNLLEELETMGRAEKRSLKSRLVILLAHLLTWQYQPDYRSKSWTLTIKNQRLDIREILEDSPSLKSLLDATIARAWQKALLMAEDETELDAPRFPAQCPWRFEQFMADDFWPELEMQPVTAAPAQTPPATAPR